MTRFEIAPAEAENIAGGDWAGVPYATDIAGKVQITSTWGPRAPFKFPDGSVSPSFHNAIDLWFPHGSPIFAPDDGYVWKIEWQPGGGNVLWLAHGEDAETWDGDGVPPSPTHITIYAHLSSLPKFPIGTRIRRRDIIAYSGNSGQWTTGPHLHFGVWRPDSLGVWRSLDPASFDQLHVPKPYPPVVPNGSDRLATAEYYAEVYNLWAGGKAAFRGSPDQNLRNHGWYEHHVYFKP